VYCVPIPLITLSERAAEPKVGLLGLGFSREIDDGLVRANRIPNGAQ
jgi:hypothetical protein